MPAIRFETPATDALLEEWRHVHNVIIPTAPLSLEEVRERSTRNHLELAYVDDVLVGNSTVWPPSAEIPVARVIARVLPDHRRRGYGEQIYRRAVAHARRLGATRLGTVVLASNTDGLRFAQDHGFVETERYLRPEDTIPWIELETTLATAEGQPDS
ncbi:GNAT superfamily N-acetyltransferase [Nocardioides thalensis]|uniref:GNAT superfamily N-acetyltransferase n=1 Tax=Nocardioides thalensis TaxID=1914755 RepID=A0A853C6Q2_9ACTN|nr:GNAT family N-acetyltransferase [Nocardioides thalensis]NYJ03545.1 GNAT superfamily N-acetyltransferase [Nocardioides thalensis]